MFEITQQNPKSNSSGCCECKCLVKIGEGDDFNPWRNVKLLERDPPTCLATNFDSYFCMGFFMALLRNAHDIDLEEAVKWLSVALLFFAIIGWYTSVHVVWDRFKWNEKIQVFRTKEVILSTLDITIVTVLITVRNEVAKVMFLHLSVILFTEGGSTWAGVAWTRYTPPGRYPPDQVHPPGPGTPSQAGNPPGPGTPPGRSIPQDQVPPWTGTPPRQVHPPGSRHTPGQVHPPDQVHRPRSRDGYCCGRYASYWNAFLFKVRPHVMFAFVLTSTSTSTLHCVSGDANVENGCKPILCICVCATIGTMLDFNVDVETRANVTWEQGLDIFRLHSDRCPDFIRLFFCLRWKPRTGYPTNITWAWHWSGKSGRKSRSAVTWVLETLIFEYTTCCKNQGPKQVIVWLNSSL